MADRAFACVGSALIETLQITVPNVGPWTAEVEFIEAPALTGQITIQLGSESITGTIIPTEDGTFGLKRQCMVVAGGGAWGTVVPPKHYHNDAGVRAQLIAADAAREAGETLGDFVPAAERLAVDYVRPESPAAVAFQVATGGNPWWVDYAGITQVGPRPSAAVDAAAYEVLAFNPHTRRGTLAVDTLTAVTIGSIITARLDAPQTIRELVITVDGEGLRARFWSGAAPDPRFSELAQVLADIIASQLAKRLYGRYQYRVVQQRADGRVDVQAVRKLAGLPDAQTIRMFPGAPGVYPELAPGGIVLLEFLEGDATQPVISGFIGRDGSGWIPELITIGGASGPRAARVGDEVKSGGLGTIVTFAPVVPAAGPMTPGTPYMVSFDSTTPTPILAAPLTGEITKGSDLVQIAGDST
jgi:hypothetical protein